MKNFLYLLIFCVLVLSCTNGNKTTLNNYSYEKLKYFKDFEIIDSFQLELGDIEENWKSVIDACLKTSNKKVLFINDGYTLKVNPDYTELIETDAGKSILLEDPLNTVVYSGAPVYDEFQYFDIFCHDCRRINYGGNIHSMILSKTSDDGIIRIINIRKKFLEKLFPERKAIEYVFFKKEKDCITLYHFLLKCPSNFDDFSFLNLLE